MAYDYGPHEDDPPWWVMLILLLLFGPGLIYFGIAGLITCVLICWSPVLYWLGYL